MIRSYFKYAFRNLVKQRGRTLINLFGLSFSIAIVVIIYLYVHGELSFDSFQENADRIYQMYSSVVDSESEIHYSAYQKPEVAAGIRESIPGVEATCRLRATSAFIGPDKDLFEERIAFVDSSFFDLFTYTVIAGDRAHPFREIKSTVLTESIARKIFQDSALQMDNVIGRTVKFPEDPPGNLYTVSAVIADPPGNSSFDWTVLVPYDNALPYPRSNDFGGNSYTYILLDENNDSDRLEKTSQQLKEKFYGEDLKNFQQAGIIKEGEHRFTFHFIPYGETYLGTNFLNNSAYSIHGNKTSLYILSSIACLILLIACFNYVMISIGTAMNRIGDFGMMKVTGARSLQVMSQFIVESFLLTLISLFLGIVGAEQLVPLFNSLAGEDMVFNLYDNWVNFLFLFAILAFIVLTTSGYVGTYLMRRSKPINLLRRDKLSIRRNGVARLSVVLQFIIAIALLISGGTIMKQLHFLVNRDVGFNSENTLVIHVDFDEQRISRLKELIMESPDVYSVTWSDRNFNSGSSSQTIKNEEGEIVNIRFLRIDPDYVKTLGLELIQGRDFYENESFPDSLLNVIVNETLVSKLGLQEGTGEQIHLNNGNQAANVIGVVRDFHFDSMHLGIKPLMLTTARVNGIWYMFVKPREGKMQEVLQYCEKAWQEVVPEFTWEYTYLSDILEGQYDSEDRWSRIIAYAAIIAIFLSCLGLMGISGIFVARRYKEVGIRKTNGATVGKILLLINRDILKWILVAYVIATPVSWLIMRRWLQDFTYRTALSWWLFAGAGLAALLISVFTITLQINRVARRNPVEALRYE